MTRTHRHPLIPPEDVQPLEHLKRFLAKERDNCGRYLNQMRTDNQLLYADAAVIPEIDEKRATADDESDDSCRPLRVPTASTRAEAIISMGRLFTVGDTDLSPFNDWTAVPRAVASSSSSSPKLAAPQQQQQRAMRPEQTLLRQSMIWRADSDYTHNILEGWRENRRVMKQFLKQNPTAIFATMLFAAADLHNDFASSMFGKSIIGIKVDVRGLTLSTRRRDCLQLMNSISTQLDSCEELMQTAPDDCNFIHEVLLHYTANNTQLEAAVRRISKTGTKHEAKMALLRDIGVDQLQMFCFTTQDMGLLNCCSGGPSSPAVRLLLPEQQQQAALTYCTNEFGRPFHALLITMSGITRAITEACNPARVWKTGQARNWRNASDYVRFYYASLTQQIEAFDRQSLRLRTSWLEKSSLVATALERHLTGMAERIELKTQLEMQMYNKFGKTARSVLVELYLTLDAA